MTVPPPGFAYTASSGGAATSPAVAAAKPSTGNPGPLGVVESQRALARSAIGGMKQTNPELFATRPTDDPFQSAIAERIGKIQWITWEYGGALSVHADFLRFMPGGDVVADASDNVLIACVKCGEWEE